MMTKRVNLYFKFILFMLNEDLQTFIRVVRIPAYISTIISAAADEGPDEMMCSPAVVYTIHLLSKISQKSMRLYANFSEKGCLYIAIYAYFSKRENEWIV